MSSLEPENTSQPTSESPQNTKSFFAQYSVFSIVFLCTIIGFLWLGIAGIFSFANAAGWLVLIIFVEAAIFLFPQMKWYRSLPVWAEIIVSIGVIIGLLVIIRSFVFLPFTVDGPSMEPTLHDKEFIYVDKLFPSIFGYERGDIVVFTPPKQSGETRSITNVGVMCLLNKATNIVLFQNKEDPCTVSASYVKRIVGVSGDRVEVRNGQVYVTPEGGERTKIDNSFLSDGNKDRTCVPSSCSTDGQYSRFSLSSEYGKDFGIVPEGAYFVMGDNRTNSSDSRALVWDTPFVPQENITGAVRMVYLSPNPVPAQETPLDTWIAAIKNVPTAFVGIRWLVDTELL